jgi:CheY-like chemotaxis protein
LVRAGIAQSLRDAGWEVLEASTGECALTRLEAEGHRIDVLFTDIQLAGHLSGWDVADAFGQAKPYSSIIYTSANGVDRRRQLPGSTFFGKPYAATAIVKACSENTRKAVTSPSQLCGR